MKEWAARLWSWIRHHQLWSSIILIVLLFSIGYGLPQAAHFMRFGPPPPAGQSCGSIIHSEAPPERNTRADATIPVLTCFWHAYLSCQPATMSQTEQGTDAGATDTVTIERRDNHCIIYGREEASANTETRNTTFLCNQLSKNGDTLQLSGCAGIADFALYPRRITRYTTWDFESYLCGIVGSAHPEGLPPQQVESCFFTAYKQCLDDAMVYKTLENGTEVERNFIIDNHCGIAYLPRPNIAATCASLELRADGLHFMQCGTDGDVFVPNASPLKR